MSDLYKKVPGAAVTSKEKELFKEVAQECVSRFPRCQTMLNVGVMWGCSMHCLRAGAPDARLIGVDLDYKTNQVHYEKELRAEYVVGDSGILWRSMNIPLQLLLIDGDHHYDAVRRDIAGWTQLVVPEGLVIFHDYSPAQCDIDRIPYITGVRKAVHEYMKMPHWMQYAAVDSVVVFERV